MYIHVYRTPHHSAQKKEGNRKRREKTYMNTQAHHNIKLIMYMYMYMYTLYVHVHVCVSDVQFVPIIVRLSILYMYM